MCGIAGFIGNSSVSEHRIAQTLDRMQNRGPDFRAHERIQIGDVECVFLHSRLSILDLDSRSNQPFTIGECTLIFNGEIYNYLELRENLEQRGVALRTTSDTEVLLQYYLLYGTQCVEHFEGMWSFAIADRRKGIVFLSRDRFAEKPFYLYRSRDGLYFGSEVKFIEGLLGRKLSVNRRHLQRYLALGYKSLYKTGETFFEGVRELPFAGNLVINDTLNEQQSCYWKPAHAPTAMRLEEAIEGFRERLIESMRIRLRADVPVAFCLSGGVDSASLVSIAAKCLGYDLMTFSIIDSDPRYDESENIQATVNDLGCRNEQIRISYDSFFEQLDELVSYHDAPVYTISYYIHSLLSRSISQKGYRVVCSGTGADEMVTGYYDHFNLFLYEMRNDPSYTKLEQEWQENTGRFVRNPYLKQPRLYFEQPDFRGHIYLNREVFCDLLRDEFREDFVEEHYCNALLQNRMMNEMFHEGTRVILHEDDLNSMKYSIENRSPYLDRRLFEFAYTIPTQYLIQDGYGKFILREAMKGILNDTVRLDRQKKGFNASIHSLVDFEDRQTRERLLDDSEVFELIDKDKLEKIYPDSTLPNSFSKFWFNFINTKLFLEQHSSK